MHNSNEQQEEYVLTPPPNGRGLDSALTELAHEMTRVLGALETATEQAQDVAHRLRTLKAQQEQERNQ